MEQKTHYFKISRSVAGLFPCDRSFTEVEAVISLELDRNCGRDIGYKTYAKIWGWDRNKTRRFIQGLFSPEGLQQIGKRILPNPVHLVKQWDGFDDDSATPTNPITTGLTEGQRPHEEDHNKQLIEQRPLNDPLNDPHEPLKTLGLAKVNDPTSDPSATPYYNINNKTSICAEPCSAPPGITIPLKDGSAYTVPPEFISKLVVSFPEKDTLAELHKISLWNISNSAKRKTRAGIKTHIFKWMNNNKQGPSSQKKTHQVKNCDLCSYNQDKSDPCPNINLSGYPAACQSFSPVEE